MPSNLLVNLFANKINTNLPDWQDKCEFQLGYTFHTTAMVPKCSFSTNTFEHCSVSHSFDQPLVLPALRNADMILQHCQVQQVPSWNRKHHYYYWPFLFGMGVGMRGTGLALRGCYSANINIFNLKTNRVSNMVFVTFRKSCRSEKVDSHIHEKKNVTFRKQSFTPRKTLDSRFRGKFGRINIYKYFAP